MIRLLCLLPFLLLLSACGPETNSRGASARQLNDSAMALDRSDSAAARKALDLLDKAVAQQPDFYVAQLNRCMVASELKDYGKALQSAQKMILLFPQNPDHYGTAGTLCERTGDTLKAREYYKMAVLLYDQALRDTLAPREVRDLSMMNKGVILIMSGDAKGGDSLLRQLTAGRTDSSVVLTAQLFLGKTKKEILDLYQPK